MKIDSSVPSRIASRRMASMRSRIVRVPAVEDTDVVADGHRIRLRDETALPPHGLLREHVVEQHGIHTPERQIAVRMHVIVVRHRHHAALGLRGEEDFVRDRAAQRGDAPAAEIGERPEAGRVGLAHGQHFAELVVREP